MATGGDVFRAAMGEPSPKAEDGLPADLQFWGRLKESVGAGYFLDRFLYAFGTGLERLHDCLDAWPFLVPPRTPDRLILGYNAYGSILVLENRRSPMDVKVLNPLTVNYWSDPNLNFLSLIGTWLPERRLPWFFDTGVYEAWRKRHDGEYLDAQEILGIGVPLTLDGKMELENFAPQDIVEYYQQAAPSYAEAYASRKRS